MLRDKLNEIIGLFNKIQDTNFEVVRRLESVIRIANAQQEVIDEQILSKQAAAKSGAIPERP